MPPTNTAVNPTTGEVEDGAEIEPFFLPKNEAQRATTFQEIIAEAESHGAGAASITVVNPWEKINQDKDVLIERPLMLRSVKFMVDRATGNEYANLWIVRDDDRLFRVTDGSTGMYRQITELVQERLDAGHPTPYNYFLFPNGLTKSEYNLDAAGSIIEEDDKKTKVAAKGATYYFAY
jgi:hypothetical protein